jgi:mono/diheme cytochrome c family protein
VNRHRRLLTAAALAVTTAAMSASIAYATTQSHAEIERGKYLAQAADCQSCHTADGGQPFAGGRPIPTPFGTIFSTNITPDATTGIGSWSDDDFYRALHEGVAPGGRRLYPAFPYLWYTRMPRADVVDIRAYLRTLTPIHEEDRPPKLPWPLSVRAVLRVWNGLFFHRGTFVADAGKSTEWNRGAYLVEGPGHCSACHTPQNIAGAPRTSRSYEGGTAEGWFAPSLAPDLRDGLGAWSAADIVEYLKTGSSAKAASGGPMAEVIAMSTQHLSDADLQAIAAYLKDLPGKNPETSTTSARLDQGTSDRGQTIYVDDCTACHRKDGSGMAGVFPPLRGSSPVQADDPTTVLQVLLSGARMPATRTKPSALAMPAFDRKLTDQDIADVATYVRHAWGNEAAPVSPRDVSRVRRTIDKAKGPQ